MTALESNLASIQRWYRTYQGRGELTEMLEDLRYGPPYHPLTDDLIVVLTRLEGAGRGSAVPVGQDLGLVYEFHGGLVKRLTAYGSHDEAFSAAREAQRA